ncbi:probable L-type lectin-domain containing receptor kinase VI.1 [Cornus florida]|uniref:probable L-type lectin-domain containing receptor kinase VI.1 n=1 Tax=Cornus florida TaxID=4283 RepID=UPI00289DF4FC|nr:probable L-type lectin-domain containing receptor kinase VI.1 [Cornus florida]
MAAPISIALLLSLLFDNVVPSQPIDFLYNRFNPPYGYGFNQTNLILDGFATIIPQSGALELTNKSSTNYILVFEKVPKDDNQGGYVLAFTLSPSPQFAGAEGDHYLGIFNSTNDGNPSNHTFDVGFNTINGHKEAPDTPVPKDVNRGGYGLVSILSPSPQFPGAEGDHYLGIFNSTNDGNPSNHIFAVEFDTIDGHTEAPDTPGNHIGININSMASVASEPVSYHFSHIAVKEGVRLESEKPIQAWIEYDGGKGVLNVTIWPESRPKQAN